MRTVAGEWILVGRQQRHDLIEKAARVIEKERQQASEWALCLIRWGLLACVVLVGLLNPASPPFLSSVFLFLVVFGIYNLLVTLLLTFHAFFRLLPALTLFFDVAAFFLLFYTSGGVNSPFFFFALLPILAGAFRFGWQVGLAAAFVFMLDMAFQVVLAWDRELGVAQLFQPLMYGLSFLLAAVVAGGLGPQMTARATSQSTAAKSHIVPENFKMVYEMASTLSATLNYERVLETILDISRLGFDDLGTRSGESVGLVLLHDKNGLLYPASSRNLTVSSDEGCRIRGVEGIVGEAITQAVTVIGEAAMDDPELRTFRSLQSAKSILCVPLRAGFETYGAVLFASAKPRAYTEEHGELLSIFCNQATIALQNASLYQSLREERDKIVDKEEEARHKLARDLHDGPTQDVAAIAMRLNFARLLIERDPIRAKGELERLEDLAHRTVKEIRSMLFTLRPIILETEGLVAALNQYADNLRESDGLPVEIQAERYQDCLDIEIQGVVFAILEEAINNARKHAQASRIWVRLSVQGDLVIAQVVDNGVGFDVKAVEGNYGSRGSLGMINLKERAELIGGTINLESAPGQGTRVTLLIPIPEDMV